MAVKRKSQKSYQKTYENAKAYYTHGGAAYNIDPFEEERPSARFNHPFRKILLISASILF